MNRDASMNAFETLLRSSIAKDVAAFIRTHDIYNDEELLDIIWRKNGNGISKEMLQKHKQPMTAQ